MSPLSVTDNDSPDGRPIPQIAIVPQIAITAWGLLAPQTPEVPHTDPLPQTAIVAPVKTELPQTAMVPHTPDVPVPQIAIVALGDRLTVLAVALKVAAGDSASPVKTSFFARAAGIFKYPAPMVKISYSLV